MKLRFRNPFRKRRPEPPDQVKLTASVIKPFSTTPREAPPPASRDSRKPPGSRPKPEEKP